MQWLLEKIRKTYFYQLFIHNKYLAFFVICFFMVNVAANTILPTEITPIYNWNLYSYPIEKQKSYEFLEIEVDNQILKIPETWKDPQRVFINHPINYYISNRIEEKDDYSKKHFVENWIRENKEFKKLFPTFTNFPNEKDFKEFPIWYKRYLENTLQKKITQINIYRKSLIFDGNVVKEIKSELVYTIL